MIERKKICVEKCMYQCTSLWRPKRKFAIYEEATKTAKMAVMNDKIKMGKILGTIFCFMVVIKWYKYAVNSNHMSLIQLIVQLLYSTTDGPLIVQI